MIGDAILNAIVFGQKKENSCKNNKKPLDQIHKELLYSRKEIQQGNLVPKVKSGRKFLSDSKVLILQKADSFWYVYIHAQKSVKGER